MILARFDQYTQVKDLAGGLNANSDAIEAHFAAINPHPHGRLVLDVSGDQDINLTAEQARSGQLIFTGVLTGNINVIAPCSCMVYHIQNKTTGNFTLTFKTGAGTGVVIQQASLPDHPRIKRVLCDGTDVVWADGSQIVEDNLHEATPDGYYIRWANRLQMCWNYYGTIEELTPTRSAAEVLPVPTYRYDIDIYFPKPFATNHFFIACNANSEHYGDMDVQASSQYPNYFTMRIHSLAEFTKVYHVSYMAVGRY